MYPIPKSKMDCSFSLKYMQHLYLIIIRTMKKKSDLLLYKMKTTTNWLHILMKYT